MKPIYQTNQNCFAAAAASILELRLNQVPRKRGKGWLDVWRKWLSRRGLGVEWYRCQGHRKPKGLAILTVKMGDGTHAVVCDDGEIVHDPQEGNIERARRSERLHWYVFTVLDAGRHLPLRSEGKERKKK